MKKLALLSVAFFVSCCAAFAQRKDDFQNLIKETDAWFSIYSTLYPYGSEYYALNKLGLTKEEIKQIKKEKDYDHVLSPRKDSIEGFEAISIIQTHISNSIKKITAHPDFKKYDITTLLSGSVNIVKSEDNKLYNFSFDAKNGGTYQMQISIMYYTDFDSASVNSEETDERYSIFNSDGYGSIHSIETGTGTKYVLTGGVRGCSSCFGSHVTLVSIENGVFIKEFYYSVMLRDVEGGVSYDPETKTISVSYLTDDLTRSCTCENEAYEEGDYSSNEDDNTDSDSEEEADVKQCDCTFIFNGIKFKLVKESWEIIETE